MIRGNSLSGKSGDIAAYTTKDDYFSEGGQVVGEWQGEGAEHAGLVGDVKPEDFRQVLDGIAPDGQQLGTVRNGELEHRPGWDFTISAPKSVSEIALVAGDPRAIAAHEAGVKAAIAVLEKGAQYRERVNGEIVHRQGYGIIATTFNHSTSRAGDPQLHTHVIIANMVRAADGTWRSLETREMFALQRAADMAYKAEVAAYLERDGYELDIDRKGGNFEVRGVPESLRDFHSQRTEQIEHALQAQGLDRETASAELRDKASLDTRAEKMHEDPAAARERWQADAKTHGWDYEAHKRVAAERAVRGGQRSQDAVRVADHAVAFATQHLSERESRFPRSELETVAMGRALGEATPAEIRAAVDRAVAEGTLVTREIDHGSNHPATAAFTTPQAIRDESRMLASEVRGRGKLDGLMTPAQAHMFVARVEVKAAASGRPWNEGQRTAAIGALTSRNAVTGIQGYAGTSKTSSVLATLAEAAKERSVEVKAMAATGTAAQKLGREIGAESSTVTKFLNDAAKPGNEDMGKGGVWVVDESSLLSTGQARALVELAEGRSAHLIVTGDVKQHEAVEAGGPFAQLQAAGMKTYVLGDILRQQNEALRSAVYLSLEGKVAEAFAKLEAGGGGVVEIANADSRHRQIAKDYIALPTSERDNTLLVSAPRDGRDAINAYVREGLAQQGDLSGPAVNVQGLDRVDMTKAQAHHADSFQVGQVVQFAFNLKSAGLDAGKVYEVEGTNNQTNRVTLKAEDGSLRGWNPKQGGASHVSVAERVTVELRQGDTVALTGRVESGINGMMGRVEVVNGREATVRLQNGDAVKMREGETLPVRHGYVLTTVKAQGLDNKHVMGNMPATGKGAGASTDRAEYGIISRGKCKVTIYTDSREKLIKRVSVPTAKTNALDRGAETVAAQHGRSDDWVAIVHGPTIAEAKQRIAAGLDKPQAAAQHDSTRPGLSPAQVAERMGANKVAHDTSVAKPEATRDGNAKPQQEATKAPRIEEVRDRIASPIERSEAHQASKPELDRQSGNTATERESGYTTELTPTELERGDQAIRDDLNSSLGSAEYAAAVLDPLRDETLSAEAKNEMASGVERGDQVEGTASEATRNEDRQEATADAKQSIDERQSATGNEAAAERDPEVEAQQRGGEQAEREPLVTQAEQDRAEPSAERNEPERAAAGQVERPTEPEAAAGRDAGDGQRAEQPEHGLHAEREATTERTEPEHGDGEQSRANQTSVADTREWGPESSETAAWTELDREREQLIDHTAREAEITQDHSEVQTRPSAEEAQAERENVEQQGQDTERSVQPTREDGEAEQNHNERQSTTDKEAATDRGPEVDAQQCGGELAERELPVAQAEQERAEPAAERGAPERAGADQVETRTVPETAAERDAGDAHHAEPAERNEQIERADSTDERIGQVPGCDSEPQRQGLAPSDVAERMTAAMVDRAVAESGETSSQLAHEVEREQVGEGHGNGQGEDHDHKHEDGLER